MSDVRCDGFMIEVGTPDMDPARAPRVARRVAKRRLGEGWSAHALSKHSRWVLLRRKSRRAVAVSRSWSMAERIEGDREVARAEPAFRIESPEIDVAQPRSGASGEHLKCSDGPLWSLALCRVPQAWSLAPKPGGARFGKGIVIGHPDTGYTLHPEIWDPPPKRRVLAAKGYDFEDHRADPRDPLVGSAASHGTSTASVIMSDHDPTPGGPPPAWVSGVAPEAKLVPFRVSDKVVHWDFTNVTLAIYRSIDEGAHVISMSLGGGFGSHALRSAVEFAVESGVILLAVAGNVWPWVVYPAKYAEVVAVAAVNCRKEVWSKSAAGKDVDVSAPGESVWIAETKKGNPNTFLVDRGSGTSYSTATTAGAAALWLAHHGRSRLIEKYGKPNLAWVFREVLKEHGFERPAGWNTAKHGVGILRVDRLLAAPLPDVVAARSARRPSIDTLERLLPYLPEADRAQLRRALASLLRVSASTLDETLAAHADELVFHLATNPDLRARLGRASRRGARRISPRRGLASDAQLARHGSPALRAQMGL